MSDTLVLQSHRMPLPAPWLASCLLSVKNWAEQNRYDYHFMGDEFFDVVSKPLLEKTRNQKVIAADLARLKWLQHFLDKGYRTVVWCDADFLIFCPDNFQLPEMDDLPERYALGREVWVQPYSDGSRKLKVNTKVHNAFMLFRQGNSFLNFYTESAERLLVKTSGSVPPQFIGPKLLTAIHNVVQCPVLETAGMLSPLVIKDLINGDGPALQLFQEKSNSPTMAANLCNSMCEKGQLTNGEMEMVIGCLIKNNTGI